MLEHIQIKSTTEIIRNIQENARRAIERENRNITQRTILNDILMNIGQNVQGAKGEVYGPEWLQIILDMKPDQGFYDLLPILEYLDSIGFECEASSDYPENFNRDFRLRRGNLSLGLAVYLDKASPSCKRVEVGFEMVRQPKYKLVCNGADDALSGADDAM